MPQGNDGEEQVLVPASALADMLGRIALLSGQLADAVAAVERRKSEVVVLCRSLIALHERCGAAAQGTNREEMFEMIDAMMAGAPMAGGGPALSESAASTDAEV